MDKYDELRKAVNKPEAWLSPKVMTLKGASKTNLSEQDQADFEGCAVWAIDWCGDRPPITDKRGVTHIPRPLYEVDAETITALLAERDALREALRDMTSGWRYIRETHGDLYGVGWDRAEEKARAALGEKP